MGSRGLGRCVCGDGGNMEQDGQDVGIGKGMLSHQAGLSGLALLDAVGRF